MSWTDVFPVLSEEQVSEYQLKVTPEEMAMLDEWCGIGRVIKLPGEPASGGSSILSNRSAMWLFLALEEEGRWMTITDAWYLVRESE